MRRLLAFILIALLSGMGLRAADEVRIMTFDEGDGFAESRVSCIIQDRAGIIWFSTWDGLYRYDGYRLRNYKARPGDNCPLEANRIDYIRELADGNILCRVRSDYFVFNRTSRKFTPYTGPRSAHDVRYMPDEATQRMVAAMPRYAGISVRILYKDRQGGIWVYSMLGLDRISFVSKPISNRKATDAPQEEVRGLMEDSKGRLWVADKNGYVRIVGRDGRLVGYLDASGSLRPAPVLFGHSVYCIREDSRGTVWMGAKGSGLFRLTPSDKGFAVDRYVANNPIDGDLNHNDIYSIVEDSYGRMWIGTYGGGLNVATVGPGGRVTFANSGNGLPPVHEGDVEIHRLAITPGGVLLVGTNTGLYTARIERNTAAMKFHANRRDPADATSLSNNRVTDIVQARSGNIFVSTYGGGLCRIMSTNLLSDTITFRPYTTDSGLASDVVMSVTEDKQGRLWLVSGASLSCFVPSTGVITNFKRSMFSGGFVFSEARPLCMADGRLVMGTTQGILEFNPAELKKSSYVPPIVVDCGSRVELGPNEKSLSIEMAALDYNKNEQIEYAYKLDGVDETWNYTTDSHIRYANIPAGKYLLHIKSTNGDGIWTDNERTIEIHRTPAFNERPMAWMLYGGLLLVALYAIFKVAAYIRRLQRELSDIKMTTGEKVEYALLKHGERHVPGQGVPEADVERERDDAWSAKVWAYMERNMANAELTVDSFAQDMGMSRSVFYLNMKRVFGVTPNNFMQEARIAYAKELLRAHSGNISEVAYKCGFSDPKYFSRCFKKATGMTPSEYC